MNKLLLSALLISILALGAWTMRPRHLTFTVTNLGAEPLRSTVVHVTGRSYPVGDIAPGASRSLGVDPLGASHIELSMKGLPRLRIDCYFESGYEGSVTAGVTSKGLVFVKDEVRLPALF